MKKNNTTPHIYLLLILFLSFFVSVIQIRAQEVYHVSWILQDIDKGFQQQLASNVIDSLNLWLTRDNPEAATARQDDLLRITVSGLYNPLTDQISERIIQLKVGTYVITDDPSLFLDSILIDSLLRRNYYWRKETIDLLDQDLTPEYYQSTFSNDAPNYPSYERTFSTYRANKKISLDETVIPLTFDTKLFAGLGFEETAMPLFSYHRARLGIEHGIFRAWYEAPLSLESFGSTFGGKNAAAHGAGMSFTLDNLGGSATFSNQYKVYGTNDTTPALMSKSVLLYGIQPISWVPFLEGWFRIKLGAGLVEETTLRKESGNQYVASTSSLLPRPFVRGELQSLQQDGTLRRRATLQIFGETLSLSWFERFYGSVWF